MSTMQMLQDYQRIFGFCPCCGELFRLSDATLFYNAPPPSTPFDDLNDELLRLQRSDDRLQEQADRLKEKAKQKGRLEMERRLNEVMSFFRRQRIALRDMKLLFHPVDYVVFRGLSEGECTAVELLDREPESAGHERLQRSIERTVDAGNYSWITMQIADDGKVTCG
jgi:predicted Holliday junction resolvase-like endonuclease